MITKISIDNKHIEQANDLEAVFFDIIDRGLPNQHRVLKAGKSLDDFNLAHGEIWLHHNAELLFEGLITAPIDPPPVRDLAAEIDALKVKVAALETAR